MTATGEIIERSREELVFAYRESSLDELVILAGEFQLEPRRSRRIDQADAKTVDRQESRQPLGHQSAGCIFKNPRGMSAGMLIEQAGLKNTRVGQAAVSERHANSSSLTKPGAPARTYCS